MNMFKPTTAKDVDDLIGQNDEPRKTEMKKIHRYIRKTLPKLDMGLYGNIIGYGSYHYKSTSGREGDWFLIGLASQKNYISLYVCAVEGNNYIAEKHKSWFPKASVGKSCIRFKKFEDIDFAKLEKILIKAGKLGPMNKVSS